MYSSVMRTLLPLMALILVATTATAADPLVVTSPVWSFTAEEGWGIWWPDAGKPKPYTLEAVAGGLRLTLSPGTDELHLNLWSERFKTRDLLGAPQAVALDVELVTGAAEIGLDIYDAQQEGLHFAERTLQPGRHTLTWEMSEKPQHSWGEHRNLIPDPPLGLWGLAIGRRAASSPTVLLLHAGLRRELAHASDLVTVSLDTGSPIHLLHSGQAPVLVLSNRATVPVQLALSATDEDWAGTLHPAAATVTVPASGTLRWPLPTLPTARGIHWITCTLADAPETEPRTSQRLPYALLDEPVKRAKEDGFLFGVVGMFPGPGDGAEAYLARAVETLRWLALRNLRSGVNWEYVEHEPGQWDERWLDWFSQAIDRCGAVGTRIQFLLCYTTRYAAAKNKQAAQDHLQWMFSPPDLDAWRRYVAKMVSRFGDRIHLWEAWNEADIDFWRGTIEQYEQLLHVTHEEVKRGDPTRRVMNSGFAFAWPRNGNKIAEVPYRVAKESRADYDILAYHLHHQFGEYRSIVDGPLAEIRKQAGDPPLLFNECAVNLDVLGERGQAEQLPKKLLYAWSKGAIGYYWYNLTGGKRLPIPGHDANWGLMTDDFHPRAVFCSYHTLMGLLADATCNGRLPTSGERLCIAFATPAGQVIAAWDEDAHASHEPLVVAVGASARCTAIDLMGVRTPLPCENGICLMPVGHAPGYLLIEGSDAPVALKPSIVHLQPGQIAIPGRSTPLQLRVANPLARAATLTLSWTAPSGLGPIADARVDLPAGGGSDLTLALGMDAGATVHLGDSAVCTLHLAIAATTLAADMPVPVMLVRSLPAGEFARPADITLDERRFVVNLHANVPQWEHRNWRGPEDLSLVAWIGRQGDRLALRVVVRDDRHVQNHTAAEAWQGDSLQVGLATPGTPGFWEFILARDGASGAALVANSIRPPGCADASAATALSTTRVGDRTTYEVSWPLSALALSAASVRAGLALNLLVNDDDGEGRNGWIELAPGLGLSKEPAKFPIISLE
jgi:hypothetical protein